MRIASLMALMALLTAGMQGDELDDKLVAARKRLEELRVEVEPLARPLMVTDAGLRAWVSGGMLDAVLARYNALPKDKRKFTYQSTGQQRPLRRGGSSWPAHCGWEMELRDDGALRLRAWPEGLRAIWDGFGEYRLDGRLDAEVDLHVRGRIFMPAHVWKCVTTCLEVCNKSGCHYECDTDCSWEIRPCNEGTTENSATAGSTFKIYPPPLCTAGYCPQLTIRPLDALERQILSTLEAAPAASRNELATRLGAPLADVEARLAILLMASLVEENGQITLAPDGKLFAQSLDGAFVYTIHEDHKQGTGKVDVCVDLVLVQPCISTDVTLPVGLIYAGAINLASEDEATLEYPDGYWFTETRSRDYSVIFTPTKTASTNTGIEARGNVRVEWSDLLAVEEELRVHYVDVGTGDAILVQTPRLPDGTRGKTVLIDVGPTKDDPLTTYLENRPHVYLNGMGVRRGDTIDYLILTHDDAQHISGIASILEDYEVATVIHTGRGRSAAYKRLLKRLAEETANGQPTQILAITDGTPALDFGPLVMAQLLSPSPDHAREWSRDDGSIVLRVEYGKHSMLFTGDITSAAEENLIASLGGGLASTVLKIANHGSRASSGPSFIEAVKPDLGVFTTGTGRVGFRSVPSQEVVDRFETMMPSTLLLTTEYLDPAQPEDVHEDNDGDDILVLSDGKRARILQPRDRDGLREWVVVREIQ